MLLEPTNLLVLDEPTNHLDMQSKDILKNALIQYDGALIIVSHDRDFLAGLTEKVYEFRKPLIREYIGDIYDFLRERELKNLKELELSTVVLPRESREENASEAKLKWERKKNLEREKRKLEKEVERIENEINTSEYELKSRDQMLANPANYMAETFDKLWYENYERIKQNLADDLKHWEQLHTQLDDLSREIENLLA